MPTTRSQWSSRLAFIMATSGAAVGLGNIWKFPYIAGENGGGAFVLMYLLCIIIIGVPVMIAEILLGRRGQKNPGDTMAALAQQSAHSVHWQWLGCITILAGFIILSYYSVIAGWALDYIWLSFTGAFTDASATTIDHLFSQLTNSPILLTVCHSIIMITTTTVVACGIKNGLEKATYVLFPALLLLLLVLIVYATTTGFFAHGLAFLLHPDFSKLSAHGALIALGHAFFTLSLACGTIMVYGSYLPKQVSIIKTSIIVASLDTLVALLAGLAIFPLVFANQLAPGADPGLIFQTLPLAFGHMPMGTVLGTIFFVMLLFAAFTSAISLLEPSVAWLHERSRLSRPVTACICGFSIWLLGLATVFSFNIWQQVKIFGLGIFDALDYLTANLMLPLGGLVIAIFSAYIVKQTIIREELDTPHAWIYVLWRGTLRYLTPLAILAVFLQAIGILSL